MIKHYMSVPFKDGYTYCHVDDPIFRRVVGEKGRNRYTRSLLKQMGFVQLVDKFWVWPCAHLDLDRQHWSWGESQVPLDCPGRQTLRLNEMIKVLKSCQVRMDKAG